jgi:hypothetical protein
MTSGSRIAQDWAVKGAAAATTAFFVTLTAFSLLTLDRLKYAIHANSLHPSVIAGLVHGLDIALIAAVALSFVAMCLVEWHSLGMRRLASAEQPIGLLLAAGGALVWFGHCILAPGLIVTGDAGTHVGRVNHLALALMDGDSLFWDNWFFGGSTLLQFTGPVFHWFAAGIQLLTHDPTWAIKYACFVVRLLQGLFMYLLARRFGLTRPVAVITALFYAGSFFVTNMEIVRSSFPQFINFAAMPAVLFFIEGVLTGPAVIGASTFGLALSAIVFVGCHQPTALVFALLMVAYLAVRLAMLGWPRKPLGGLSLAAVGATAGSAFFLVPFAQERSMTADNFATDSLVSIAWPSRAFLGNILIWGRTGLGAEYSTYFGLVMVGCAVAGGVYLLVQMAERRTVRIRGSALRNHEPEGFHFSGHAENVLANRQARRKSGFAALYGLFVALSVGSTFVHGAYVRHYTITFFFLCMAAGLGLQIVSVIFQGRQWAMLALFVLLAADLGPAAIQPWTRADAEPVADAGKYIAARFPDRRIMEVGDENGRPVVSVDPNLTPLTAARVQILAGLHKQDATPAHNPFAATMKLAEDDMRNGGLGPSSQAMLASLNVGLVVGVGYRSVGLQLDIAGMSADPVLGWVISIPEATPILASSRLETMPRPDSFDAAPFWNIAFEQRRPDAVRAKAAVMEINRAMRLDPARRQAGSFILSRIPPGQEWSGTSGGNEPPRIALLNYSVGAAIVRLAVEADRPGFLRLAHPLTPSARIERNGQTVMAVPDVEGLIVMPLLAGRNDIVVSEYPSSLRQACFWITAIVTAGLLMAMALSSLMSRGGRRHPASAVP